MRWFAEGRNRDIPDPSALPSHSNVKFGSGLGTQSGLSEFVPNSLRRLGDLDPERPTVNRYIPSWEGPNTAELSGKWPLQLITTHPAYSFHTMSDAKGGGIDDLEDHRITVNGYAYWVLRLNPADAASRGIAHHDLVRVFNGRSVVICGADANATVMPGVVKAIPARATTRWKRRRA